MRICINTCFHLPMRPMHACMHACTPACIYTHAHTYIHTYTRTNWISPWSRRKPDTQSHDMVFVFGVRFKLKGKNLGFEQKPEHCSKIHKYHKYLCGFAYPLPKVTTKTTKRPLPAKRPSPCRADQLLWPSQCGTLSKGTSRARAHVPHS